MDNVDNIKLGVSILSDFFDEDTRKLFYDEIENSKEYEEYNKKIGRVK